MCIYKIFERGYKCLTKKRSFFVVLITLILLNFILLPAGANIAGHTVQNDINGKIAGHGDLMEFSFTVEKGLTTQKVCQLIF
jgi:hypothetical protein